MFRNRPVHRAESSPLPIEPSRLDVDGELRLIRQHLEQIAHSRIIRSPVHTIGWGIVISFFLWLLLLVIVFLALVLLGLLPFVHWK